MRAHDYYRGAVTDRLPFVWGATRDEAERSYPADELVPGGRRLTRAVSVTAPSDLVFRWTCQLHRAPYSYDLIDNLARRSPSTVWNGVAGSMATVPLSMFLLRTVSITSAVGSSCSSHTRMSSPKRNMLRVFGSSKAGLR